MDYKRIIIFTGGVLAKDFLHEILPDDLIIAADRGALYLIQNGIKPHIAVGDFDSITEEEREIVLPAVSSSLPVIRSIKTLPIQKWPLKRPWITNLRIFSSLAPRGHVWTIRLRMFILWCGPCGITSPAPYRTSTII